MLEKLDRDMIIEMQIERRRRHRVYESSSENDKDRVSTRAKLYLLRVDGSFRTV